MAEVAELVVVKVGQGERRVASGCCEPECGPETCGPGARDEEKEQILAQEEGCCEPDCGPETCRCP